MLQIWLSITAVAAIVHLSFRTQLGFLTRCFSIAGLFTIGWLVFVLLTQGHTDALIGIAVLLIALYSFIGAIVVGLLLFGIERGIRAFRATRC